MNSYYDILTIEKLMESHQNDPIKLILLASESYDRRDKTIEKRINLLNEEMDYLVCITNQIGVTFERVFATLPEALDHYNMS